MDSCAAGSISFQADGFFFFVLMVPKYSVLIVLNIFGLIVFGFDNAYSEISVLPNALDQT
jgi:hypothetical protein